MQDLNSYPQESTLIHVAGRVDGVRIGHHATPYSKPGPDRIAESKGVALVTEQWLSVFGVPHTEWVSNDFQRRIREHVRHVVSAQPMGHAPRPYSVALHLHQRPTMEVDWRNRFQMRFQGDFECRKDRLSNKVHFSVAAFMRRKTLLLPPCCSHFRFFLWAGIVCDFVYSPERLRYIPLRPDVLGRCAMDFSRLWPCGSPMPKPLELTASLPPGIVLDSHSELVAGFGLEFWKMGRACNEDRIVDRVMVVG